MLNEFEINVCVVESFYESRNDIRRCARQPIPPQWRLHMHINYLNELVRREVYDCGLLCALKKIVFLKRCIRYSQRKIFRQAASVGKDMQDIYETVKILCDSFDEINLGFIVAEMMYGPCLKLLKKELITL